MHVGSNVNPKSGAQKDLFLSLKKAGTPEKPIFHQSCPIFLSMLAAPFGCGESGAKTERRHFLGHWLTLPLFFGGDFAFGARPFKKEKERRREFGFKELREISDVFLCTSFDNEMTVGFEEEKNEERKRKKI